MNDVKNSRLYKTLCKAVRKKDHAELLRMLEMVPDSAYLFGGKDKDMLCDSFDWSETPQGTYYWWELSDRLKDAGHDCY
jgi:hypothetical protein